MFTTALIALALAVASQDGEKKKPPFADGPEDKAKVAEKPESRTWTVNDQAFAFTLSFAPGIPDAKQMTEVLILANEIPKTPHPQYGSRVPLFDARITLEIQNPAGEVVGTYLAHPIPLAKGKYGLHMTPTQNGIYTVNLKGKTSDGRPLSAMMKMPVATWPLPKELEGSGDDAGGQTIRRVIKQPGK